MISMTYQNKTVDVIHIIDSLQLGGAEKVLVELVNQLRKRDLSVAVCITRSVNEWQKSLNPQIEVLILGRNSTWEIKPILSFMNYCHNHRVKIVHVHSRSSLRFTALIKAFSLGKFKLVFHDHYGKIRIDKTTPILLQFISIFLIDYYIGVSKELLEWARTDLGVPKSKSCLLRNAIDLSRFQNIKAENCLEDCSQPQKAVMVANLRPQKDHPLLLAALSQSKMARELLHVYFIGADKRDEYSQTVHQMIKDLHLEKNVNIIGMREDIPKILNCADYGLLSSKSESGPLVLLEYLAAGLPFVTTRTGEITSLLSNSNLGLFVEPHDVQGYSLALDRLVSLTPQERQEFLLRSKHLLAKEFDISTRIDQLLLIYHELGLN